MHTASEAEWTGHAHGTWGQVKGEKDIGPGPYAELAFGSSLFFSFLFLGFFCLVQYSISSNSAQLDLSVDLI